MTTAELARLPWTFQGPASIEDDGEKYWEVRIAELPDFVVLGLTKEEVYGELNPALEAFLNSYVEIGQQPPLPAAVMTISKGPEYAWRVCVSTPAQTRGPDAVMEATNAPLPGVTGSFLHRRLQVVA